MRTKTLRTETVSTQNSRNTENSDRTENTGSARRAHGRDVAVATAVVATGPTPTLTRRERVSLANDLRIACMRISRRVRFETDPELPPHQFSALSRLEAGPRTNSELAEIEKVSAPSMKRTTQCLVDVGLVARADDPTDGRQVILTLTPEGRKAIKRIRRHRDEWMLARLEGLSDDERHLLLRATSVLEKVAGR